METYEQIIKDLDATIRRVEEATLRAVGLDDKLRFRRLRRQLRNARHELRKGYFEYEDVVNENYIQNRG